MKRINLSDRKKNLVTYICCLLLMAILISSIYNLNEVKIDKPIKNYTGDGLAALYLMKTTDENGWFLENAKTGGQFGAEIYDYAMSDNFSFACVRVISIFTDNAYLIYNIFYFLTYFLVMLSCLFVLLKLGINRILAVTLSILYAFLPYHQLRITHIWLEPYFMIPLVALVSIWLLTDEIKNDNIVGISTKKIKNKKFLFGLIISFMAAFTGMYYAFFTCCTFAVVIVMNAMKKKWKVIGITISYIIAVATGVFLNALPSLLYFLKNGLNPVSELSLRSPMQSEMFGLKLIQFFIPRPNHRVSLLAEVAEKYSKESICTNENSFAALGIVGSIGLILLLIEVFNLNRKDDIIKNISLLNIGTFLIATIGGIGAIFAYVVNTPMRCYNRISVFIGFYCFLYIGLCLTSLFNKFVSNKVKWLGMAILCISILCIGVYDQMLPFNADNQKQMIEMSDGDSAFVSEIESILPENSMIFQLPYINFPSGGTYAHFRGYLNSNTLKWSFGTMQGREGDRWVKTVASLKIPEMIEQLSIEGYSGIYLDCSLYRSLGITNYGIIIQEICDELKVLPIYNVDTDILFYDMTQYNLKYSEVFSKEEQDLRKIFFTDFTEGFYREESFGDGNMFRWCNENGTIIINNKSQGDRNIKISGTVLGTQSESNLRISHGEISRNYHIGSSGFPNAEGTDIEFNTIVSHGINEIKLKSDAPLFKLDGSRIVNFYFYNYKID